MKMIFKSPKRINLPSNPIAPKPKTMSPVTKKNKKSKGEELLKRLKKKKTQPRPAPAPAPGSLRNRVVAMKTLTNLKKVAKNRKIKGYTKYKKNSQENLRTEILKNINKNN